MIIWMHGEHEKFVKALANKIQANPDLAEVLVRRILRCVSYPKGLRSFDSLLADPEGARMDFLQATKDVAYSQAMEPYYVIHDLLRVATKHPVWWRQHWGERKEAVPYPEAQASDLTLAITTLWKCGVQLPEDIRGLVALKEI